MEAEQVAEREQMKKAEREKRLDPETNLDGNASGQWQESEAGLEWVVIPEDERGNNGQTNNDNHIDNNDEASNCSDDLQVMPGSQEEDENFTKGKERFPCKPCCDIGWIMRFPKSFAVWGNAICNWNWLKNTWCQILSFLPRIKSFHRASSLQGPRPLTIMLEYNGGAVVIGVVTNETLLTAILSWDFIFIMT